MLGAVVVSLVVALMIWHLGVRLSRLVGPCASPGCRRRGWWRTFLIVRPDKGATPDPLVRLPMPACVCGSCARALKRGDKRPERAHRLLIQKGLRKRGRPDWNRTEIDFENVLAARLRGHLR